MLEILSELKLNLSKNDKLIQKLNTTIITSGNTKVWYNLREAYRNDLLHVMKFYYKLQKDYKGREHFSTIISYDKMYTELTILDNKNEDLYTSKIIIKAILEISKLLGVVFRSIQNHLNKIKKAVDDYLIHVKQVSSGGINHIPRWVTGQLYLTLVPLTDKGINKFYITLLGKTADNVYSQVFDYSLVEENEEKLVSRGLVQSVRNLQKKLSE